MAGNNSDLEIIVKLRNEASKVAKTMTSDLKGSFKTIKEDFSAVARDFKAGTLTLGGAFKALILSVQAALSSINPIILVIFAVAAAVAGLVKFMSSAIPVSLEFGNAMSKLSGAAARFGQDIGVARDAAISLSQDGLINTATAAEGLSRLMATGLNINQAVEIMNSYKDMAALGRSSSIDMNQAVLNLSQSFVTERSQLADNSGMWENYKDVIEVGAQALGKKVSQLNNAERTLAKYTGTLLVAQRAEGDAQRMSSTYQGSLARLSQSFFMLKVTVGTAVIPILNILANVLNFIAGIINKIASFVIPDFIEQLGKNLVEASTQGIESMEDFQDAMGGLGGTVNDTAKRMKQAMADFAFNSKKAVQEFKRSLADLVFSHKDKVASLKKQIEEERKNLEERVNKMKEPYEEMKKSAIQAGKERIADLKAQLDKELAKGSDANAEKIDLLNQFLAEEQVAIDESIAAWDTKANEEIQIEIDKAQEKIDSLNAELADEEAILYKHRGIIKSIKNLQREDDIEVLLRQNKERTVEMGRQYQKELDSIKSAGTSAGSAYATNYINTLLAKMRAGSSSISAEAKKPFSISSIVSSAITTVKNWWNTIVTWLKKVYAQIPTWGRAVMSSVFPITNLIPYLKPLAKGGIVNKPTPALIGESGPEAVIPLSRDGQRNADPSVKGMLGGVSQVFNLYQVSTALDVELAMSRAAMMARRGFR